MKAFGGIPDSKEPGNPFVDTVKGVAEVGTNGFAFDAGKGQTYKHDTCAKACTWTPGCVMYHVGNDQGSDPKFPDGGRFSYPAYQCRTDDCKLVEMVNCVLYRRGIDKATNVGKDFPYMGGFKMYTCAGPEGGTFKWCDKVDPTPRNSYETMPCKAF